MEENNKKIVAVQDTNKVLTTNNKYEYISNFAHQLASSFCDALT